MHTKDFDTWNKEKKAIDMMSQRKLYIQPREIWSIKLGINIGDEENGKGGFMRPVLIISKIGSLFFVIPMTTKIRYTIFYYQLRTSSIQSKDSCLLLSQGRVIDRRRFIRRIGNILPREFAYIKKLLGRMYLPIA